MGLEGGLRVGLRLSDGRVDRVRISSTRPDVARSLLQGRGRAEIRAAVPRLFSICAHSQASASELACAAAAGEPASADLLARSASAVAAEIVRECAWRTLLDWPRWLGESPGDAAVAAARASLAFRPGTAGDPAPTAIALAAFDSSADEWLALPSVAELDRWMDAGRTASARYLRAARDDDAAADEAVAGRAVPLLDAGHDAAWMLELAKAGDADAAFARHPTWRGVPAETGALARLQSDPLVAAIERRSASRVPARFAARLRELALLLAGRAEVPVGAATTPAGAGIGWLENARGLLVHEVRFDEGRAAGYRIVAPTEWNFHPGGVLASTLTGTPAGDPAALKSRTERLVNSLDPCVACRVEFDDA